VGSFGKKAFVGEGLAALVGDRRGATMVGVAAIGTFHAFGETLFAKTDAQAELIRAMGTSSEAIDPTAAGFALPTVESAGASDEAGSRSGPPFDTLSEGEYRDVRGVLFATGPGDDHAIHPSDLTQGSIGDCYLIASLATIAQHKPEIIEKGIRLLDDGNYEVTLYQENDNGDLERKTVVVSPTFPSKDDRFVFAKPGDLTDAGEELWPMLYEKAYAQLHGSYDAIGDGGSPMDSMASLTGLKSWWTRNGWLDLDIIAEQLSKRNAVAVTTLNAQDATGRPLFEDSTLYARHVYYVTEADAAARTVTVRNPWGWDHEEIVLTEAQFEESFKAASFNPVEEWKEPEDKPWWQFW
jgi:hypothetical protein